MTAVSSFVDCLLDLSNNSIQYGDDSVSKVTVDFLLSKFKSACFCPGTSNILSVFMNFYFI